MADYTNKRGIFSLLDVRERQNAGNWSTRGDVWLTPSPLKIRGSHYSYEGGHYSSPSSSPSTVWYTNVQRMDIANDTATFISRAQLIQRNDYRSAGTVSSFDYGYFGGGGYPRITTVYRLDYANDNTNASTKGPLTQERRSLDGASNTSYGWFGGGSSPGYSSIVDRIDFSNDTTDASPKGPLSLGRFGVKAVGNQNYGWFMGGIPGGTKVDRVDYSNDTATASVRGPLTGSVYEASTGGNANFGYEL